MYTVVLAMDGGRIERYTVDSGHWSGPVPFLVRYAEVLTVGIQPYQPDPDYAMATAFADALGGQIVEPPEMAPLPAGATP